MYQSPLNQRFEDEITILIGNMDQTIGKLIKMERLKKGWSQQKLAQHLRINQSTVSRLEQGHWFPQKSIMERIKHWLDKDIKSAIHEVVRLQVLETAVNFER